VSDEKTVVRGARLLVIDSQVSGVSGDMLLGALVDLGASPERISAAFKVAAGHLNGCRDLRIETGFVNRRGIRARKVDVLYEEETGKRSGLEVKAAIASAAGELGLSEAACQFAAAVVESIISAERKVHGKNEKQDVHFHEIGSADTVGDILGVTVALDELGIFIDTAVYATPVAVGSGSIEFSHGKVPVPAPATLEIMRAKNLPMTGGAVTGELATPTGVSLVGNLAGGVVESYPPMKPLAIGYGAGTKEFREVANVVRLTLGEALVSSSATDQVYVLETNLDDVSGEVIGYAIERLLEAGSRDCCVIPITGKKGRPGQILQVMAAADQVAPLARLMMAETGTLGVRYYPCGRFVLARETVSRVTSVGGGDAEVRVKIARDEDGRVVQLKPEYEDARRLAESSGLPLREVLRRIQTEGWGEINRQD